MSFPGLSTLTMPGIRFKDSPMSRALRLLALLNVFLAATAAAQAPLPPGETPKLRYGFKPDRTYIYEIKIVATIGDIKETREGLSSYTVKSATAQQIVLRHSGSLSTRRARRDGQPVVTLPSLYNPLVWSDRVTARPGELTVGVRGNVMDSEIETALPYMLGDFAALVFDEFPAEPKAAWQNQSDALISQRSRSRFPPIPHGPFRTEDSPGANRSAHECTTYTMIEYAPEAVRIRKTYRLWTDDKADDRPRRELTGEGEQSFDLKEGVPKSQLMEYELQLNEENLSLKVPLVVSYRLLDHEEAQQRFQAAEQARLTAQAAVAKANEPKPLAPNERELLLAELKDKDGFKVRRAADRLAQVPAAEKNPDEVAKALAALLSDRDRWIRLAAAKALVVWATPEAAPALIAALDDKDVWVRIAAMEALGRLKTKEGAQAVARQLPILQGRPEAVKALKAMGAIAEPAVLPYLKDRDDWVRQEACKILEEIGTDKSLPALTEFESSGNFLDRKAAEKALKAVRERK